MIKPARHGIEKNSLEPNGVTQWRHVCGLLSQVICGREPFVTGGDQMAKKMITDMVQFKDCSRSNVKLTSLLWEEVLNLMSVQPISLFGHALHRSCASDGNVNYLKWISGAGCPLYKVIASDGKW